MSGAVLMSIVVSSTMCLAPDAHAQKRPPKERPAPPPKDKEPANPKKAMAADLFKKSAEAYLRGDFNEAIKLLDEAYTMDPQPVLIYNKARAHEGLGHSDEAINLYELYLSQEPNSADRGAIEQRLATLKRQKEEKNAVEKERSAVEKERAAVEKERANPPPPPPEEPPHKRSVLPYVVMGVGGAGLVTGTIFGFMAISKKDAATTNTVQVDAIKLRDTGKTFATVSNVSFIVGGALVAAGAVWWVLDSGPKRRGLGPSPTRVGLGLGPGFVTVGGTLP